MPLSDADILTRVQRGEQELFGQLAVRYVDRFLKVAGSKLGDAATAEDVVQETFLAAFAARDSYDPRFAVSTWLWTILLNLCRARVKRQQSRPWEHATGTSQSASEGATEPRPSALATIIAQEESEHLHQLLHQLPEPQADALRLRFFGELKYEDIALAMECSVSGAKRRVRTGLEKLSRLVQESELLFPSVCTHRPPSARNDPREEVT